MQVTVQESSVLKLPRDFDEAAARRLVSMSSGSEEKARDIQEVFTWHSTPHGWEFWSGQLELAIRGRQLTREAVDYLRGCLVVRHVLHG